MQGRNHHLRDWLTWGPVRQAEKFAVSPGVIIVSNKSAFSDAGEGFNVHAVDIRL